MPELPEVDVVRAGLAPAVTGARVVAVEVRDARALKRHQPLASGSPAAAAGSLSGHGQTLSSADATLRAADFERRMTGARFAAPARRGKFLWLPLVPSSTSSSLVPAVKSPSVMRPASSSPSSSLTSGSPPSDLQDHALLAHLGMSGQMLLRAHEAADDRHVRIRLWIEHPEHGELRLDFADQRLFGSLALDRLVPTPDGRPGGLGTESATVPGQAAHIARDPLDPAFEDRRFISALRSRNTAVKRALLDQTLVSGVGNIYADEALWRARIHPETSGVQIGPRKAAELLARVREVFAQALTEGGTSFDEQYVNVNGQAGYFAHSLNAYGRGGEPCPRCGGPIRREAFMNRGSHFCPRCQRKR